MRLHFSGKQFPSTYLFSYIQHTFCLSHELEVYFIQFWRDIFCECEKISAKLHPNCESHSTGQEISRILGTQNVIATFEKSRHLMLSPAVEIQVIPSSLFTYFNIILPSAPISHK
jgi:hypothetical protein